MVLIALAVTDHLESSSLLNGENLHFLMFGKGDSLAQSPLLESMSKIKEFKFHAQKEQMTLAKHVAIATLEKYIFNFNLLVYNLTFYVSLHRSTQHRTIVTLKRCNAP